MTAGACWSSRATRTFRPTDYKGPEHDRILLLEDIDPATARPARSATFFEGTTHTMNLAVYHDGSVYVATRSEIFRLRDTDDDGKADERTPNLPSRNGRQLSAQRPLGLCVRFRRQRLLRLRREPGGRLQADRQRRQVRSPAAAKGATSTAAIPTARSSAASPPASGIRSHLGFDAFGRLFAVDNDPDSRPPCRLLHIVEGGDYGFRFRNGRKGVHPFTAWNGELPGTLPMVAGTGEAPCAVLAYESDNLPEEYRGDLLVTSWGDHRLERYRLRPRGASFGAEMTPVLRGERELPPGRPRPRPRRLALHERLGRQVVQPARQGPRVADLGEESAREPSRPEDPIAALSSPHGPWREAAARKLPRAERLRVAAASDDARTQAIAARALGSGRSDDCRWIAELAVQDPQGFREVVNRIRNDVDTERESKIFSQIEKIVDLHPAVRLAASDDEQPLRSGVRELSASDPFSLHAATAAVIQVIRQTPEHLKEFEHQVLRSGSSGETIVVPMWKQEDGGSLIGWALVIRTLGSQQLRDHAPQAMLTSRDPEIQLIGLQWIAESKLRERKEDVEKCGRMQVPDRCSKPHLQLWKF